MGKSEAEGACMRGRVGVNASMCVVRDIKKRGAELNSAGVLMEAKKRGCVCEYSAAEAVQGTDADTR